MTDLVFVTPAKGGLVRMPDKGSTKMPEGGTFVPRTSYYERLIVTGDLIVDENRKFQPPKDQEVVAEANSGPVLDEADLAGGNPVHAKGVRK